MPGALVGALIAPRDARAGMLRRLLPLLPGAACVIAPAFLPREWPIVRTIFAFAVAGAFLRLVEIARKPATFEVWQRVINVLVPFLDARRFGSGPRGVRWSMLLLGAVEIAAAIALLILAARTPPLRPYASVAALERTLLGGASCYLFVDATGRSVHGLLLSVGIVVDKPHDAPILSRSLGEFWGKRWNRIVNRWLRENTFLPVATRTNITVGVLAAFVVSGAVHFVPLALVCSIEAATWMGAFFVLHGVLVILETKLRLSRVRPAFGHALTIGIFLVTTPIFVEPMLETLGF